MSDRPDRDTDQSRTPPLRVLVWTGKTEPAEYLLEHSARIGRDEACEVCVDEPVVSRSHAELTFEKNSWWLRDLGSTNGLYVGADRVECIPLQKETRFTISRNGPTVVATPAAPASTPTQDPADLLSHYTDYYVQQFSGASAGERTAYFRRALHEAQCKQRRRNTIVMTAIVILLAAIGAYTAHERRRADTLRSLADDLFYAIKSVELQLAASEKAAIVRPGAEPIAHRHEEDFMLSLGKSYDRFVSQAGLRNAQVSEEEKLILRVTRIFGEYDGDVPETFVAEVKRYIEWWRSTNRFKKAIQEAEDKGYVARIASALNDQKIPPQFLYLALQESDFNTEAVGPQTRKGIAKGMWQFIPETAIRYGLELGPLYQRGQRDPRDDRHDFEKSTLAAARYLKAIYTTDAQGSALLVMASYNWGEGNILALLQTLPPNPRDRNFWRLLSVYRDRIPEETYNYVFRIVAAAVIGENPKLFGFNMENPLRIPEGGSSD